MQSVTIMHQRENNGLCGQNNGPWRRRGRDEHSGAGDGPQPGDGQLVHLKNHTETLGPHRSSEESDADPGQGLTGAEHQLAGLQQEILRFLGAAVAAADAKPRFDAEVPSSLHRDVNNVEPTQCNGIGKKLKKLKKEIEK